MVDIGAGNRSVMEYFFNNGFNVYGVEINSD
jgi:hypothetical protein